MWLVSWGFLVLETSLGSLQNYREGLVVRWKNEEMNRAGTPAKRWDQGGFLGPHMCFSYTVTPSWDERLWLAYFSLCQALFRCIFQQEEACAWCLAGCPGAVQPCPGWSCWMLGGLQKAPAAGHLQLGSLRALMVQEEVLERVPCIKFRMWGNSQSGFWATGRDIIHHHLVLNPEANLRAWRVKKWCQ